MKILHFISGDLWAGAEVQFFHLAKRLVRHTDISLLVVLLNHGKLEEELIELGVQVNVLDETSLSNLVIFRELNKLVKAFRPDIIHTHHSKENVMAGLIAPLNGVKSIRTEHGAEEFSIKSINLRKLIAVGMDKLAALVLQKKVVAVSQEVKKKLSKICPASKIAVIENCVDIGYIEAMSNQPSELSIDRSGFNIAFVGRFVPVKRVDLFYSIAKTAIGKITGREINFHMLGDGPLKKDIEEKLTKDGLGSKIHLYGFVENVAPILKQMDLLLFTSDHEGLPMTLLEAMTLEVPVLSRHLLGIHSALCNGECGYFVNSDVAEDFVKTISQIISEPDDVKVKMTAARRQIENNYDIDVNVAKYLKLYDEVAGN